MRGPQTAGSRAVLNDTKQTSGGLPKWKRWDPLARWLLPRLSGWPVWAETVIITLLAVLISRYAAPEDPFQIKSQFPWPWLAPVLIALRYGVLAGTASAAILFIAWASWVPDGLSAEIPKLYFLGGLLTTMICGEYSGIWRTRLRRMSELNSYLEDRVERITKRLYLLRLSHDRLEQELLSRPVTLRDALTELRRRIAGKTGEGEMPGAQAFVEFLAQYCQIEVAAIYAVTQSGDKITLGACKGRLGEAPALRADDPLYLHARDSGRLTHVQTSALDQDLPTDQLVVAPMITSGRRMVGVLAVSHMPFFALNEDTLQMMQVLLSAYADDIRGSEQVLPLLAQYPGCPPNFVAELVILQRIQREFDIESNITVLIFGDSDNRIDMYQHVLRQRRGPDVIWEIESLLGRSYIINQMPLAGKAAVEGYLVRTEMSLKQNFGGTFTGLNVRSQVISLSDPQPLETIKRLLLKPDPRQV